MRSQSISRFSQLILAGLLLLFSGGCASPVDDPAGDEKLSVDSMGTQDDGRTMLRVGCRSPQECDEALLDAFRRENSGIQVEYDRLFAENTNDRGLLFDRMRASDLPDVLPLDPETVSVARDIGMIMPLDDQVDSGVLKLAASVVDGFGAGRIEGELFAVCSQRQGQPVVAFNAEMLHAVDLQVPSTQWTWDDLEGLLRGFRERTQRPGIGSGLSRPEILEAMLASHGTSLEDAAENGVDYRHEEVFTGYFAMLRRLTESGAAEVEAGDSIDPLVDGHFVAGILSVEELEAHGDNLRRSGVVVGTLPFPYDPVPNAPLLAISASVPNPEHAALFISFVTDAHRRDRARLHDVFAETHHSAAIAVLDDSLTPEQGAIRMREDLNRVFTAGALEGDLTVRWFDSPYTPFDDGVVPSPPLTDRNTVISVLITNQGLSDVTTPFTTQLLVDGSPACSWSFPSTAESGDPVGDATSSPVIAALGGSRLYDCEVPLAAGKHKLEVTVNVGQTVNESREDNNTAQRDVTAQLPPDLMVDGIQTYAQDGTSGTPRAVPPSLGPRQDWQVRIRNAGSGPSAASLATLLLDGCYVYAESLSVPQLAPGASAVLTGKGIRCKKPGSRTFEAIADAAHQVTESNETNNTKAKTFQLDYVDFEVKNLSVAQNSKDTTIRFDITNKGKADANETFYVYLHPGEFTNGVTKPGQLTFTGVLGSNVLQGGLESGQTKTITWKGSFLPGVYNVVVQANSTPMNAWQDFYLEANYQNNTATQNVTLNQTHYVVVDDINENACGHDALVSFKRNNQKLGALWIGPATIKFTNKSSGKVYTSAVTSGTTVNVNMPGGTYDVQAYAVDNGVWIASSAPNVKTFVLTDRSNPTANISSVTPCSNQGLGQGCDPQVPAGRKTRLTVNGSNFFSPDVTLFRNGRYYGWVSVVSSTTQKMVIDMTVPASADRGSYKLAVKNDCAGYGTFEEIDIVNPTSPPAESKQWVVLSSTAPLQGGPLTYVGKVAFLQPSHITGFENHAGNKMVLGIPKSGKKCGKQSDMAALINPGKTYRFTPSVAVPSGNQTIMMCPFTTAPAPKQVSISVLSTTP